MKTSRIGIGAVVVGALGCAPVDVRVMAFNASSGAGGEYRTASARFLQREFLAAQKPDVVFVVEVDQHTGRNWGAPTLEQLWPGATGVFGRSGILDLEEGSPPGEYGVGLLFAPGVLDRIEESRVVLLPSHLDEEPRVALVVDAWLRGAPVRLVCTHLSVYGPHSAEIRAMQAAALLELKRRDRPVIIAGDFNGALQEPTSLQAAVTSDVMGVVVWGAGHAYGASVKAPEGVTDHEGAAVVTVRLP